jgi:carbon storage regulator
MLVLTRKLEESIRIGDNVEVQIVGIKGNSVKLGISAPREIEVVRKELDDRPENRDDRH